MPPPLRESIRCRVDGRRIERFPVAPGTECADVVKRGRSALSPGGRQSRSKADARTECSKQELLAIHFIAFCRRGL